MPPFLVIPLVIPVNDHLRMVDRIELIAVDDFPLQVGVEPFNLGVVLRRRYMGELLIDTFLFTVGPAPPLSLDNLLVKRSNQKDIRLKSFANRFDFCTASFTNSATGCAFARGLPKKKRP